MIKTNPSYQITVTYDDNPDSEYFGRFIVTSKSTDFDLEHRSVFLSDALIKTAVDMQVHEALHVVREGRHAAYGSTEGSKS